MDANAHSSIETGIRGYARHSIYVKQSPQSSALLTRLVQGCYLVKAKAITLPDPAIRVYGKGYRKSIPFFLYFIVYDILVYAPEAKQLLTKFFLQGKIMR